MSKLKTATIMRQQGGSISRSQALDAGLTEDQVRYLVRGGAWTRILPGIYLAAGTPLTWQSWVHIVVLAAGADGVLVGATATQLRRWTPPALPITVAIPHHRRLRIRSDAVRVLRLDVPDADRVTVDGLPTTTRLRTAVDIAHLLPGIDAQPIIDRMLVLDRVDLDELTAAIKCSHRHGSAQARALMRSAADLAAAESERLARRLFRDAGITGWTANLPVQVRGGRTIKTDLTLERYKIAVEVKGWMFHSKSDRAKGDDDRITDLQLAGWFVIPVGWLELRTDPAGLIAKLRAAIEARSKNQLVVPMASDR